MNRRKASSSEWDRLGREQAKKGSVKEDGKIIGLLCILFSSYWQFTIQRSFIFLVNGMVVEMQVFANFSLMKNTGCECRYLSIGCVFKN